MSLECNTGQLRVVSTGMQGVDRVGGLFPAARSLFHMRKNL